MQAIILAAGKGTRLHSVTGDTIPKSLVKVNGTPILERIIRELPDAIDEIVLIVWHHGDQIKDYCGDSFAGKRITYVEVEPKGTGYALMEARPFIKDGHFLLLYGDDLCYQRDLERLLGERPAVLVKEADHPENFGVCLVDGSGMLCDILEKRQNPPTNLVNTGLYLLNHEIFDIPMVALPNGEFNLAEQIGNWAKRRPVQTITAEFWQPINNAEELSQAQK